MVWTSASNGLTTVNRNGEGFADFGDPGVTQSPDSIDKHTYGNAFDGVKVDSCAPDDRFYAWFKHHFTRQPSDGCCALGYQRSMQTRDGNISGEHDDRTAADLGGFAPPKFSTQRQGTHEAAAADRNELRSPHSSRSSIGCSSYAL